MIDKWLALWRKPQGRLPKLESREETANRVAKKRQVDLARWAKIKADGGLGDTVTRQDVEHVLKSQGFKKKRGDRESIFVKRLSDRSYTIWFRLKTFGESETYAPSQQLLVSASLATHIYSEVEAEITDQPTPHGATMGGLDQRKFVDFVLTQDAVTRVLAGIEADLDKLDPVEFLAKFRTYGPERAGSAGLRYLAALAIAGDIDTLGGYVRRRMDGDPCGFVPFISDDMISRAAKIGHRNG